MSRILFLPEKKTIQIEKQATLLKAAIDAGIYIASSCGGKQKCGKCVVSIKEGYNNLPHPGPEEMAVLSKAGWGEGYRLACATPVSCDLVVEVPRSVIGEDKILTKARGPSSFTKSRSPLKAYGVNVPSPTLSYQVDDMERLNKSLGDTFGLKGLVVTDPMVLKELPGAIRSNSGRITAIIRNEREIIKILPDSPTHLLGAAIDLGTTTVVCYLMDLKTGEKLSVSSSINPQIKFGEDVISRISYCSSKGSGLQELRREVVECVNRLVGEGASKIGASPGQVMEMLLVGNTAMHHLFLGLDPRHLSLAPYIPVVSEALDIKAREAEINISKSAYIHLPPLKAGFLGSDAISGLIATGLYKRKKTILFIGLGTNGELVIGNRQGMMGCSTAAGPAFEGGHIRWGMRAAPGAVERVKLHDQKVILKTIRGKKPVGICGSGLISAVAELIRNGLLLTKGNFNPSSNHPNLRKGQEGVEFLLCPASENSVGRDIVITQKDISELQLAKAAIWAGAKVLEKMTDLCPEEIFLAGAGGTFVDPEDAKTIGLFPFDGRTKIQPVGNAAGLGATLLLVDNAMRKKAIKIANKMDYFELSGSGLFQDYFVQGMFFPGAIDYSEGL